MSEATIGANDAPTGKECPEGQVPKVQDDGTIKCVPITAETDKNIPPQPEVTASITDKIIQVVTEHVDAKLKAWDQHIEAKIHEAQSKVGQQIETGLRKSLGLEVDPPVHMSDLADFARKLQLETAPHGKRSPAAKLAGAGPDGNTDEHTTGTAKELNAMWKEYFPEGN